MKIDITTIPNGYRFVFDSCVGGSTIKYITKETGMKKEDKPTESLEELIKIIGPEQLMKMLPPEPKYKMKGAGFQRTKFNITQQGVHKTVAKAFFAWLPESHKCYVTINNTPYKHISPEATSVWILLEKHKLDLTVDYETLLAFSNL